MTDLQTASAALIHFGKYLHSKKEIVRQTTAVNKNRHFLIRTTSQFKMSGKIATLTENRYYLVYHSLPFQTFSQQFPKFIQEYPDFEGVGESLNKEWLELAVSNCELTQADKMEELEIDYKQNITNLKKNTIF